MIGKNVDISVTSVLQTTAGKMIFGKFDERGLPPGPRPEPRVDTRKNQPAPSPAPAMVERQGGNE